MDVASKLQLSGASIRVVNTPEDIDLDVIMSARASAVLVFVRSSADVRRHEKAIVDAASRDELTWVAYPKAGKLGTDLNRDRLWQQLDGAGIRPVRQVSLDDTWSAVRFRPGKANLKK